MNLFVTILAIIGAYTIIGLLIGLACRGFDAIISYFRDNIEDPDELNRALTFVLIMTWLWPIGYAVYIYFYFAENHVRRLRSKLSNDNANMSNFLEFLLKIDVISFESAFDYRSKKLAEIHEIIDNRARKLKLQ